MKANLIAGISNLIAGIYCLGVIAVLCNACGDDHSNDSQDKPIECPNCAYGCDSSGTCYVCSEGLFTCSEDNTAVLKCIEGRYTAFRQCEATVSCESGSCGDSNQNHLKDEYEPETSVDCIKNADCNTGFCDRLIGKCSVKCTKDEQCMDGHLCRSDGYCAPEAFVTEWEWNQGVETTIFLPTAYADECHFTVDWGDGTAPETYTSCPNPNVTHTYKHVYDDEGNQIKDGNIIIRITGTYKGWRLCAKEGTPCTTNSILLYAIRSFGPVGLGEYAFRSLRPIHISEVDIPNADLLTSMNHMFYEVKFGNGELHRYMNLGTLFRWDISHVTDMSYAFAKSIGNRDFDLSTWDTSNVTDMSYMFFYQEVANFGISNWDVSHVTNMTGMFQQSGVNEPIGGWDVSNVTNMSHTFDQAYDFNQDISGWNVSNVTDMNNMFANAFEYNQPLNSWDVSNVTDMSHMFEQAWQFNQPLDKWDVSNVTNMNSMFDSTQVFRQDLSSWQLNAIVDCTSLQNMFHFSAMSCDEIDSLRQAWGKDSCEILDMTGNSCP